MFEPADKSQRLRVHYSNGNVDSMGYLYLSTISYQQETGSLLLYFRTGGVIVQGRNLLPLLDGLEAERITRMQPFDPERHLEPGEGEPVVESIRWMSMREALQDQ